MNVGFECNPLQLEMMLIFMLLLGWKTKKKKLNIEGLAVNSTVTTYIMEGK